MIKKDPKVGQLYAGLNLEKQLKKDIFNFLQYEAISVVMDEVEYWHGSTDEQIGKIYKHSVRVSPQLMSTLHEMLETAKKKLGFKEPIDLYVINDERVNAHAVFGFAPQENHVIFLNSALINRASDDEILSVIGHEVGHLIGRDAEVNRLMSFVYPDHDKDVPRFLHLKLTMLHQLQEIRCDRCGCIASGKLEPNITAQFALMCGVNFSRFGGDVSAIIERSHFNLKQIKNGIIEPNRHTHPDDPIRIRAMEIFFNNDDKRIIEKEMSEIIELIKLWHDDEMDKPYADFLVSAGLMIANIDGKITDEEINTIVTNVVDYYMFPIKDYKRISKKDIESTFIKSAQTILEKNPLEADNLMKYILRMMVADQHINADELHMAYNIARNVFEMSKENFSSCYAEVIQEFFNPRYRI